MVMARESKLRTATKLGAARIKTNVEMSSVEPTNLPTNRRVIKQDN